MLGHILGLPNGYRDMWKPEFFILFAFFLIPANFYIYGINDLFDRDTDSLNARKSGVESTTGYENLLADRDLLWVIFGLIISGIGAIGAFLLIPDWLRGWFILFLLLCTFYSAPPLRFKARPFFDSYSNALYVIPGFIAFGMSAGTLPPVVMMLGAWAWAAGMHAYSAIPDIQADSSVGIATIATTLGKRGTLIFVGLHWTFAAVCAVLGLGWIGLIMGVFVLAILVIGFNPRVTVEGAYRVFPLFIGLIGFLAFVLKTLILN